MCNEGSLRRDEVLQALFALLEQGRRVRLGETETAIERQFERGRWSAPGEVLLAQSSSHSPVIARTTHRRECWVKDEWEPPVNVSSLRGQQQNALDQLETDELGRCEPKLLLKPLG